MSTQTVFVDPVATTPTDPAPANTGNGTISAVVVSSSTLTESFTLSCTVPGGSGTAQFSVVGSVSGNIGTATSNTEFVDVNKKVRFTITAGGTPFIAGDDFAFNTTQGAPLSKTNFDSLVALLLARIEHLSAWNTALVTVSTAETTIAAVTHSSVAVGDKILVHADLINVVQNTSTGVTTLMLDKQTGTATGNFGNGHTLIASVSYQVPAGGGFHMAISGVFTVTGAGNLTLRLSALTSAGTMTVDATEGEMDSMLLRV